MQDQVLSSLQFLETCIDRLETHWNVNEVHLGVRGTTTDEAIPGNAQEAHDSLFAEIKTIESSIDVTNGRNYQRRIKAILGRFRGQLNYVYLYSKAHQDHDLTTMNKYYFDSVLVDFMAKAIIDKIQTWPRRNTPVSGRLVQDLERFIHSYCNCGSQPMRDSINNIVTRWFQEMQNDQTKRHLVNGYIIAFNDAFGISLYDD